MEDKVRFMIGGRGFEIDNLGQSLTAQFIALHAAHLTGGAFDFNEFTKQSWDFLGQNPDDHVAHDGYFNSFTHIWRHYLAQGRFLEGSQVWDFALGIAYEWEDENQGQRIHKGTPYYFQGVTHILNDDLERGFLLMHRALEEDKMTHNVEAPTTAAHALVTLNHEETRQFFREKVLEISTFLDRLLEAYRAQRGGTLTLADFKSKFLEDHGLQEGVFYFVFTIFRIEKLL